jgi:hypothetical protein
MTNWTQFDDDANPYDFPVNGYAFTVTIYALTAEPKDVDDGDGQPKSSVEIPSTLERSHQFMNVKINSRQRTGVQQAQFG